MVKSPFFIAFCTLNLALIGFFYVVSIKWVKKIQALEKKVYQLQKLIRGLQTADMRFSRKVDELQHETEQLSHSASEMTDSHELQQNEKYRYALKLLQMGMGIDEVMKTCEIGHAEAELLQSIEGYQRAAQPVK